MRELQMRRFGRWGWWVLRCWFIYGATFAVVWLVLGEVIDLLAPPPPRMGDAVSLSLIQVGLAFFGVVGIPSLILVLLFSGLRRSAAFRLVIAPLLLLPLLVPLLAGGGIGMVTLLVIQLLFALWLMPSDTSY